MYVLGPCDTTHDTIQSNHASFPQVVRQPATLPVYRVKGDKKTTFVEACDWTSLPPQKPGCPAITMLTISPMGKTNGVDMDALGNLFQRLPDLTTLIIEQSFAGDKHVDKIADMARGHYKEKLHLLCLPTSCKFGEHLMSMRKLELGTGKGEACAHYNAMLADVRIPVLCITV